MIPGKDGTAIFTHLREVEKQTGQTPFELLLYQDLEYPDDFHDYLNDFYEISRRRRNGMSGPEPISFSEIQAWAFCYNIEPTPLQTEIICELDIIWLRAWEKNNPKQK
jgi:hypothetical protein